jgi:hypothetical protein
VTKEGEGGVVRNAGKVGEKWRAEVIVAVAVGDAGLEGEEEVLSEETANVSPTVSLPTCVRVTYVVLIET